MTFICDLEEVATEVCKTLPLDGGVGDLDRETLAALFIKGIAVAFIFEALVF